MPVTTGQGQSAITNEKERGFRAILECNAKIVAAINRKKGSRWPYWHFDLNCGSGWNDAVAEIGSPLIATDVLQKIHPDNHYCFFVDNDPKALASLTQQEGLKADRHFICEGDNADFIPTIPYLIESAPRRENPRYAFGSVYCDPNGTNVPLDRLGAIASECRRLDIIINAPFCAFKRSNGTFPLNDLPYILKKRYWLIRRHSLSDPWQWAMLIGRNGEFDDYSSMGFVSLESKEGRRIASELTRTRGELRVLHQQRMVW